MSLFNWCPRTVDELTQAWKAGAFVGDIIKKLKDDEGKAPTRGSVIGKASRLGLPRRDVLEYRAKAEAKRDKRNKGDRRRRAKKAQVREVIADILEPEEVAVESAPDLEAFNASIPINQRKSLMELGGKHCRFIVGETNRPGYFFCGGPANFFGGHSYCAGHRKFTHQARRR